MTVNPYFRAVALLRKHILLVALAGVLTALGSFVVGAMSPDSYVSQAVISIEPKKSAPSGLAAAYWMEFDETSIQLNKAATLLRSPEVLHRTAEFMLAEKKDMASAFPKRVRLSDFKERVALMARRLKSLHSFDVPNLFYNPQNPDEIGARLGHHVSVQTDNGNRTLLVKYEASKPLLAQDVLRNITESYLEAAHEKEDRQLTNQLKYLKATIETQEQKVLEAETRRQHLLEANPDLIGFQAGEISARGKEYLRLLSEIDRIRSELDSERRYQQLLKVEMRNAYDPDRQWKTAFQQRLQKEIGDLEFEKFRLKEVYDSKHPQISELTRRQMHLKSLLNADPGHAPAATLQALTEVQEGIKAKEATLQVLQSKLETADQNLRSNLKTEFSLASINKQVAIHEHILTELRNNFEGTKMQLAGTEHMARLQNPATLPLIPNSLSLNRRTLFGFVTGGFLMLSLLFLFDLMNPRLLTLRDFTSPSFFAMPIARNFVEPVVGKVWRSNAKNIRVFLDGARLPPTALIEEVARKLKLFGKDVLVISVEDKSEVRSRFYQREYGGYVQVSHDEAQFVLPSIFASSSYDTHLVLAPDGAVIPGKYDSVYFAKVGESKIQDVSRWSESAGVSIFAVT